MIEFLLRLCVLRVSVETDEHVRRLGLQHRDTKHTKTQRKDGRQFLLTTQYTVTIFRSAQPVLD